MSETGVIRMAVRDDGLIDRSPWVDKEVARSAIKAAIGNFQKIGFTLAQSFASLSIDVYLMLDATARGEKHTFKIRLPSFSKAWPP